MTIFQAVTDDVLRMFVFVGSSIAGSVLALSLLMRLRRKPPTLTRGQVLAQSGFLMLIVSAFYGVGEGLWGWPHYRLWILALGILWSIAGCIGLLFDALDERRHPPNTGRLPT